MTIQGSPDEDGMMFHRRPIFWPIWIAGLFASLTVQVLLAEETWYETKGDTTYRVTRRMEKRPVAATRMEPRTETVYSTEYVTELRESIRTVWVPVTRYVTQPRWQQWWNPWAEPSLAYETRAITQWELRTETVREPVTVKRQVPSERIVQQPVRELGFVEQPKEERIAVRIPPAAGPSATPDVRYAERPTAARPGELPPVGQPATNLTVPIRR